MLTNTNNLLMVLKRMPKIFIVNIFAKTHTNKKKFKKKSTFKSRYYFEQGLSNVF